MKLYIFLQLSPLVGASYTEVLTKLQSARPLNSLNAAGLLSKNLHYRSKVWGHPDNFVSSMKTHTFIYQMNWKFHRTYSQDIDKVRNND